MRKAQKAQPALQRAAEETLMKDSVCRSTPIPKSLEGGAPGWPEGPTKTVARVLATDLPPKEFYFL